MIWDQSQDRGCEANTFPTEPSGSQIIKKIIDMFCKLEARSVANLLLGMSLPVFKGVEVVQVVVVLKKQVIASYK